MKGKVGQEFYPPASVVQVDFDLFTVEATEQYCLEYYQRMLDVIKDGSYTVLKCTDAELWRDPPLFKVYKDDQSKRALPRGTFTNPILANDFAFAHSSPTAMVRAIESAPTKCTYCSAASVCPQRQGFVRAGLIK